jgi:branched-chain amino acid transport system permease protein
MVNSRFGLALRAIRDSYDAARMIGLAPTLYRSAAFVISASLAGLAGGYFVQYSQYADPFSAFSGALTFKMVFMSMVGGSYWIAGPVVGAAVILILEEIGRMLFLRGSLLLMTVVVIMTFIFMPGGIVGVLTRRVPIQNPLKKR